MKKAMWLAIALMLGFSLSASAEEIKGKVKTIDQANHSFVLEDGTRLWASDRTLSDLTPGEQVQAVYEVQGDKKFVTDFTHRAMSPDGYETTNFGSVRYGVPVDSIQAGD